MTKYKRRSFLNHQRATLFRDARSTMTVEQNVILRLRDSSAAQKPQAPTFYDSCMANIAESAERDSSYPVDIKHLSQQTLLMFHPLFRVPRPRICVFILPSSLLNEYFNCEHTQRHICVDKKSHSPILI